MAKANSSRIEVLKTYKIYIGGQFPRTESGRYYTPINSKGEKLGNICLCSRKDVRDAVGSARAAFGGWSGKTAFNRSQILYRIAEMLEGRTVQFVEELMKMGSTNANATKEVHASIDRLIYYAGWCDKFQQLFSTVNPVASNHFNFSVPEPTGVVSVIADDAAPLLGLVSLVAPIIAGGNTVVALASEKKPLCAVTFAEVLNDSDVPGGVINLLTGSKKELLTHLSNHMDVNAVVANGLTEEETNLVKTNAAINVKRTALHQISNWYADSNQNPYLILETQEVKTTWHPIENIGGSKAGY